MTYDIDSALIERFWIKVDKSGDCWEWMAARNPYRGDYGIFSVKGKAVLAHRVAWEIVNEAVPDGLQVLHRCDNPPCVRPEHLFLGDDKANSADRVAKGRSRPGFRLPAPEVRTVRWPDARTAPAPRKPRQPTVRAPRVRTRRKRDASGELREPGVGRLFSSAVQPDRHWFKLTDDQVREIRRRRLAGEAVKDLAAEFGVHKQSIYNVVSGACRSSVT